MPQQWGFQERQMAYSFMTAISDGTLKSMPITFNYMKVDDIVIHHNLDRLTCGIDYTISNNVITFKNVIPALDRIAVDRMSQRDSLRVNFVEGATFSRENMDDVLTQMLYLTQEAMEGSVDRISPTGVLDLAGNRIINLGDPVDLQDAVPLHLVVDAEKSVYASEAKCKQYRDEALGYKDAAFTSADMAYASELNAKKSEDNAKASEINAANSASSILGAVEQSAASAAAAKVSETNAKESENKTGAMVDRVEDALVAVEEYDDRLVAVESKMSYDGNVTTLCIKGASSMFWKVGIPVPRSRNLNVQIYRRATDPIGSPSDPNWNNGHGELYGALSLEIIGSDDDYGSIQSGTIAFIRQGATNVVGDLRISPKDGSTRIFVYLRGAPNGDGAEYKFVTHNSTNPVKPNVYNETLSEFGKGFNFTNESRVITVNTGLFDKGSRVYSEGNKPTPHDIGAVSSSNVVGSLAKGALFETYEKNGWRVRKCIDGYIELVYKVPVSPQKLSQWASLVFTSIPYPEHLAGNIHISVDVVSDVSFQLSYACVGVERSGSQTPRVAVYAPTNQQGTTINVGLSIFVRALWVNRESPVTLDEPPMSGDVNIPNWVTPDLPQVLPYDPEI